MYAGPRPASTDRLPSRLSAAAVASVFAYEPMPGLGLAAGADVVDAEDLRGGDACVPAGLAHVAVPAACVQAVLVQQRAIGDEARDVGVGREPGVREELDAGDALALQEGEQPFKALEPARDGGRGQTAGRDPGDRVRRAGAPAV